MNLKHNLQIISNKIIDAKLEFNRPNANINLLAVSKTRLADDIRRLYNFGQIDFGESYLQEALDKQSQLNDCDINWHFIGPIQSNKTKLISQNFNWVQSLAREKIALKLNEHRLSSQAKLNVLIQINLNNEVNKSGVLENEAADFCDFISQLPNLKLRGLMAIPPKTPDINQQLINFEKIHKLYTSLKKQFDLDTLSIGMSNDYQAAIQKGSTMVRIGTQLFGARDAH